MSGEYSWTNGVVAIIGRRESGWRGPVGTGFVLSDDGLIATCVHVLDQTEWQHGKWAEPVEIRFTATGRYAYPLVVEKYFNRNLDLAILALETELPDEVVSLPLARTTGTADHATGMWGYPEKHDKGLRGRGIVLGLQGDGLLQLTSFQTTHGYSGSPVWDNEWNRVIGMITSGTDEDSAGRLQYECFAVPAEVMVKANDGLGLELSQPAEAQELETALVRLAEMPTDRLPEPGVLPATSLIERRNGHFVGREESLKQIAAAFVGAGGREAISVVVVSGIAGLGKSQLANEFGHRYGPYFAGGVYWLTFGEDGNPEPAIIESGRRMNLHPEFGDLDPADQLAAVVKAWQEPIPRLLIFDDCRTEALLRKWLPDFGGARVLVTSWKSSYKLKVGVLHISQLSTAESVALLQGFWPDLAQDTAAELAEELGHFPLALWLAGSYLAENAQYVSPEEYLLELRRTAVEHESLRGLDDEAPIQRVMDVGRTFKLSYSRLASDAGDDLARALLHRAAFFAPGEAIPWRLLAKTLVSEDGDENDSPSAVAVGRALRRLEELGLVRLDETGDPLMHRLVAEFVLGAAGKEGAAAVAQEAVERVVAVEAGRINGEGLPGPLMPWQGHLRFVTEAAVETGSGNASWLLNELGIHLQALGDYGGAKAAYERALAIDETALGPDHPNVVWSVNNLGSALLALGDYSEAKRTFERALAIDEQTYGPDHPNVAWSVSSVGSALQNLGDYAGAKAAYERALAIDEQFYGPDHPNLTSHVSDLGSVLQALGDYAGAKAAHERALANDEKALGPDHPTVALRLNSLGLVLQAMGDYAGAKAAYERALAINEMALGPDHPEVATGANNLGLSLQSMGDYAEAKAIYERALAIDEKALGPDHPNVARDIGSLGGVLTDLGDYAGARAAYERALAIDEKVHGPVHPSVAVQVNNLGLVLQAQEDYVGAKATYQRALAIDEHILGPDHPEVAADVNNLGEAMQHLGDYAGAKAAYERALAIFEEILGPEHPNTALVRGNLEQLSMLMAEEEE